jgi:hypothetical protein
MTIGIEPLMIGNCSRTGKPRHRAMEMDFMNSTGNTKMSHPESNPRPACRIRVRTGVLLLSALGPVVAFTGCGTGLGGNVSQGGGATPFNISGKVHGGQQPVVGSNIQLYTVGTSGLKSASTQILTTTVTTDGNGSFNLAGTFNCTSPAATQVYITATGGNPGAGTNSALTLAAALGPCSAINSSTFIFMNEVTTVAAAYALAPFAADITHIGATGSNPTGLVNAFTNAAVLANTTTGAVGGTLGAGVTVPTTEINSLADIIAACVNTNGATSSNCSTLFAATGASETFGATLAIANNPGAGAITALYTLATPSAPFQPTLTSTPNDFTVAVSSTASGSLATPYGIAIDGSGNAWVTNESGSTMSEVGVNGSSLGTQTATGLFGAKGVAIDRTGNVWVANTAGNSVIKFAVSAGSVTGSSSFTAGGVDAPTAIALDSAGNAFIANFNGNSVTGLNSSGTPLSGSPFTGSSNNITVPTGIAIGLGGGSIYVTSGGGYVVKLTNGGVFRNIATDGTLQGPVGIALNSSAQVGVTGFTTGPATAGALAEFSDGGTTLVVAPVSPVSSGLTTPAGIASDGVSFWVANSTASGSLAQFAYGASGSTSPAAGYGSLNAPVGVAVDSSGSVWTTNSGNNTVSKFIGLAAPVVTPIAMNVGP